MREKTLQFYINKGIISLGDIMSSSMEDISMKILESVHSYRITRTCDGRWTTRVPDATKAGGTRMVRRNSKQSLLDYLIEFYGVKTESIIRITFGELFREWIEYKRIFVGAKNKPLSESTIRRYERDFDRIFAEKDLADMIITEVDSVVLEAALIDAIKADTTKTHSTMYASCFKNIWGYLDAVFKYAIRKRYIDSSPMIFLDRDNLLRFCTPNPEKDDEDRVLTVAEMGALKMAVIDHENRHPNYMPDYAIEMATMTGMRVGEIAALKWNSIDDEYIHIDYSEHRLDYSDRPSELVIGEPKNRKHRRFPVTPEIAELLDRIHNLDIQSEFVFVRKTGERYTGHDISCAIDRRANEAGIKKTSVHGVRRTVSSILNTLLPRETVANLLGHLETTNERFYDYDVTDKKTKMDALEEMSQIVTDFGEYKRNKKRTKPA